MKISIPNQGTCLSGDDEQEGDLLDLHVGSDHGELSNEDTGEVR